MPDREAPSGHEGGVSEQTEQTQAAGQASPSYPIVARTDFSETTFLIEIEHPQMANAARPGQFVIVMLHEHGERIPLTIADFDRTRGTITLVVQAVGKSTREMQILCQAGRRIHAMLGPLGIPSEIGHAKKVVCVGGGLGIAPIYPQARAFKEAGAYVIGVLGFRSSNLMFWEDKFQAICDEFIICTDDGSAGMKGLVTQGIETALERHPDVSEVVAIGPPIMMRACAETTRPHGVKTMVSLNPIMVDGTGMCGGCRVKVGEEIKFACVDGPDFDGHKVDFDDLFTRLQRYRSEESEAMDSWDASCRRLALAPDAAASDPSSNKGDI
ncbi:sulfide/dihydroorotate dehydrogenase-like FAD/NAD-binding protein [uncultured Cohaesibacter sp.]|uniref:sulfide/dihydroorotate dehydrogenase-like FAD/NAD-binding protein n=1 Tax=uncultured Cohaesibacter sp. TaxID=1002546 RepID=UPI00292E54D1|nr:sulfide/dihydroorotate dehydrogenase-like FAD/NAD-binding protein [uncultured Cohaesibacter sp.]